MLLGCGARRPEAGPRFTVKPSQLLSSLEAKPVLKETGSYPLMEWLPEAALLTVTLAVRPPPGPHGGIEW